VAAARAGWARISGPRSRPATVRSLQEWQQDILDEAAVQV
jgi:hypothetical protein